MKKKYTGKVFEMRNRSTGETCFVADEEVIKWASRNYDAVEPVLDEMIAYPGVWMRGTFRDCRYLDL